VPEAISVVIPSWNGASILENTLKHLAKVEGVSLEVLVVDHGRLNRDTEVLLSKYRTDSRFVYVGLDEQLGYAGACNHGSRLASHRLIAILCNDVLVEKDWALELVLKFRESGGAPIVSSLVTRPGFEAALSSRYNVFGRIVDTGTSVRAEDYVPFFPDGSSFLFDRDRFGLPFDADYFLYQEDVSIGWRAWLIGERVVLAPKSRALNADGGTTRRTPYKTAFYTERNRWLNYLRFISLKNLFLIWPALGLDCDLKFLFGTNRLAKLHAWIWVMTHPRVIWKKRRETQSVRRRSDLEIFPLLTKKYMEGNGFLNSVFAFYFKLVGLKFGA
jgi:GT2 family glycosyltransferase